MKRVINYSACLGFLLVSATAVRADSVLSSATVALQQREQSLSHLSFAWKLSAQEHDSALIPASQFVTRRKALLSYYEAMGSKAGVTDKTKVYQSAESSTNMIMSFLEGGSLHYASLWQFQRDGDQTLVTGSVREITGTNSMDTLFFDGSAGLAAFQDSQASNGAPLPSKPPAAWATAGDSLRHSGPDLDHLGLTPEYYAMLVGIDPLTLHGAEFVVSSSTATSLTVTAQVRDANIIGKVTVSLDIARGYAPAEVVVQEAGRSIVLRAESFRSVNGQWIANRVRATTTLPRLCDTEQTWELQQAAPSAPVNMKLAANAQVEDYRLLGTDLDRRAIMRAEISHNHDIVSYSWHGHFPSIDELRLMHDNRFPGEATPDPDGKASMLPAAGGMLCLISGVLMYWRRDRSAA